jgi:hypothetical protein
VIIILFMHWLLQHNLSTDEQRQRFVDALDSLKSLGATWSFIKLIPFVGDVEPDNDYTGKKVFALGSTSLIAGAKKRNWNPGVIYNPETFRYEAWLKAYGKDMLNGDGEVCRFGSVRPISGTKVFIRPCEDLKAFTGEVIDADQLRDWVARTIESEVSSHAPQLTSDTMVVVATPKYIYREWRFFVVGGKVVAGSQYRDTYGKYEDANVDKEVWTYAQKMVDKWQPAACFAIDVAAIADGFKIIEINCFNGSGVYACDVEAAFAAVERFYQ